MGKKILFKFGRPVIKDGVIQFTEEGQADECECCAVVGGTCAECFDAMTQISLTFSDTPHGSGECSCFPYEDVPFRVYSFDGTYTLNELTNFGTIKVFRLTLGTAGNFSDPGRLVGYGAGSSFCHLTRVWEYLLYLQAIVRCVDGLLNVDVSAGFQAFWTGNIYDDDSPIIHLGTGGSNFGAVDPIDTTNDCEACGETEPKHWFVGCNENPTEFEGDTVVTVNCHLSDPPDDPPDDPDPPEDPPPEPPDPPPEPPDPPDPPWEEPDCDGLDDCELGTVAKVGFFTATNWSAAFVTGLVFAQSGTGFWLPENLLDLEFEIPDDGNVYDYSLELYTAGTFAEAETDGIQIYYEEYDDETNNPRTEVYVYKIDIGFECTDGRVRVEYITLHYDVFIGLDGTFTWPHSNGQFSQTFSGALIDGHILTGVAATCRSGIAIPRISFDGDLFTPTEGDDHLILLTAQIDVA